MIISHCCSNYFEQLSSLELHDLFVYRSENNLQQAFNPSPISQIHNLAQCEGDLPELYRLLQNSKQTEISSESLYKMFTKKLETQDKQIEDRYLQCLQALDHLRVIERLAQKQPSKNKAKKRKTGDILQKNKLLFPEKSAQTKEKKGNQ